MDMRSSHAPHCPCCAHKMHPTDLTCDHCGADLASGAHPDLAKRRSMVPPPDEEESPHGFWPMMTFTLVLMTFAFFIFPPAAVLMLAVAGLYQSSRMSLRSARG